MNISDFFNILIIADEKSLSKAAKRLFVSQPSLTKCLQKAESNFNEPLFSRTSNGLIPTFAGEKFLKYAREILKKYNELNEEMIKINHLNSGNLNLGVTYKIATFLLPKILPKFYKKFPDVHINLIEDTAANLEKKF